MANYENFCLHLNEFKRNVKTSYQQPQDENDFCDAPLACGDGHIKTHTVLISF